MPFCSLSFMIHAWETKPPFKDLPASVADEAMEVERTHAEDSMANQGRLRRTPYTGEYR
jgi:hypothetical protein